MDLAETYSGFINSGIRQVKCFEKRLLKRQPLFCLTDFKTGVSKKPASNKILIPPAERAGLINIAFKAQSSIKACPRRQGLFFLFRHPFKHKFFGCANQHRPVLMSAGTGV